YPSCPSGTASSGSDSGNQGPTAAANNSKPNTPSAAGLEQLFRSLKSNQSSCIDLESIYGNQRVRLMACEILRIIFHHLSLMMDASNSSLFGNASTSGGRFFTGSGGGARAKQSDTIPGWAYHLRPFAQYLHDMLLRCEVQRNVLQCLI